LAEHEVDLVALHQPVRMLKCLWRAIRIVQHNIVDLASIDASAIVDRLHVRAHAVPDLAD